MSELDAILKELALSEANLSNLKPCWVSWCLITQGDREGGVEETREGRSGWKDKMKAEALPVAQWMAGDGGPPAAPETQNQGCHWIGSLFTTWSQLQLLWIEAENNFSVALQEEVLELMTTFHSRLEDFHTRLSKQPHVGSYWQLTWGGGTRTSAHGPGYLQRLYCSVTLSWRPCGSSRREKQGEWCIESLLSHPVTSAAEAFLPLSGDSKLSPTLLLLKFLPPLVSQAQ